MEEMSKAFNSFDYNNQLENNGDMQIKSFGEINAKEVMLY